MITMVDDKTVVLENEHLKLTINTQRATFACLHKPTGVTWDPDPWQGSLGFMSFVSPRGVRERTDLSAARRVAVSPTPTTLSLALSDFRSRITNVRSDRVLGPNVLVELAFALDPSEARFSFSLNSLEVDSDYWSLDRVVAPLRHFYARTVRDNGYFVVPAGQGGLIPTRYERGYFRYLNWIWEEIAGFTRTLDPFSMPWFGGVKDGSGFTAVLETPYDAGLEVVANNVTSAERPVDERTGDVLPGGTAYTPRLTAVSPVWKASHGALGYPRTCRYTFLYRPDVAQLAKVYRRHAQEQGFFKSLKEKIAENPNVEKLIGGPNVKVYVATHRAEIPDQQAWSGDVWDGYREISTSFAQLQEIIADMADLGIERGMIHVAGWGAAGYDHWRPMDTLPINEEAGGESAFAAASALAREKGFVLAIHDNYRNLDLNAPSYDAKLIGRHADGTLQIGFSSHSGPSHQICSANQLPLLRKTSQYMVDAIKATGYFLDTTTATQLQECYEPGHPLAREDDVRHKSALLAHLKGLGLVVGAEAGQFWGVRHCDFFEGMMGTSVGIPVPLFNLVFHDAAVVYWQHARPYNYGHPRGNYVDRVLMGLLYGNSSNWVVSSYVYPGWRRQFREVYELTSDYHRRVGCEEMTEFAIHSADHLVQSSAFADGTRVAVNYAPADYTGEVGGQTVTVPFRGFRIAYPDGKVVTGQVDYVIQRVEG